MARYILLLAVLSVSVAGLFAAKSEKYIGNASNPAYPGQCYYKEEDVAIPVGGKYLLKKECEVAECLSDLVIRLETCPFYGEHMSQCELIVDKSAQFPKCCPTFKCPK